MSKRRIERNPRLDPLTSLLGGAAWSEAVEAERVRRARYRRPVAFIIAEVGGLPAAGSRTRARRDELLVSAARLLRHSVRDTDVVARIADDQFAVMLPETPPAALEPLVTRLRAAAEAWSASVPDLPLAFSIGWAVPGPFEDLKEALRTAHHNARLMKRGA
jgi:diguanylate cyclase (GGDEF)-like protein